MTIFIATLYWQALPRLPIALGVSVVAVALTLRTYAWQLGAMARAWAWTLPALRVAALVALAVSILRPVVIRPKTEVERGAVVVLVDDSRSMSVVDAGRSPAQLISLASALGRLPANRRDENAAALQEDADQLSSLADAVNRQRSELDYARLAGRGVESAQARLEETIRRLSTVAASAVDWASQLRGNNATIQETLSQLSKPPDSSADRDAWLDIVRTRVQPVAQAIEQARSAADAWLFETDPQVNDICTDLSHLSRLALAMSALEGPNGLASRLGQNARTICFGVGDHITPFAIRDGQDADTASPLAADGSASNLTAAARVVLDRMQGTPIRGLVFLSDGRQVGGDVTVPSALAPGGVPIYGVNVAPRDALKDASIIKLSAPTSAFLGETITVRAEVRAYGLKPGAVSDLTLTADGKQLQTRPVAFGPNGAATIEFPLEIRWPGAGSLELGVVLSPIEGEATQENNLARRWLKVIHQKLRIAAYTGEAGWDFQYVRNALSRAPWCSLSHGILSGGARLPLSPPEILQQDVLMLFDVAVSSLDASQWNAVNQLVSERGGSVILVAGDAHLPAEYFKNPGIEVLLPFASAPLPPFWRTWSGDRPGVHILPTNYGGRIDALRLTDDPEPAADRRWQQLPGVYRFLPISPLKANARALLVEGENALPVLTEARVLTGRVLMFGNNETWRWRYKVGGRDQDRFWLQLVRYAAEDPYMVVDGNVALDADVVEAAPTAQVHVRARVLGQDGLPTRDPSCAIIVQQDGRDLQRVVMSQSDGRLTATIGDLPQGSYELKLDAGGAMPHPSVPLRVRSSYQAEMADLSVEDEVLRRMARTTGGDFLRLDQIDTLPQKLTEPRQDAAGFVERSLWDGPPLYAFVVACLSVEWALRKRFGLA